MEQLMPTTAWESDKRTLARHLTDETWGLVVLVEHAVKRTGEVLLREEPDTPIPPAMRESLANGRELCATMYEQLTGKAP